jgi:PEP-CTERM motif
MSTSAVPEPATLAMALIASSLALFARRRSRRGIPAGTL